MENRHEPVDRLDVDIEKPPRDDSGREVDPHKLSDRDQNFVGDRRPNLTNSGIRYCFSVWQGRTLGIEGLQELEANSGERIRKVQGPTDIPG